MVLSKNDRIRTSIYPPLVTAFEFRHPVLAVELRKPGSPVWEWYHKTVYWSLDRIRVPSALLTQPIDKWKGFYINDRVGPEQVGLKRVAVLIAARLTVETVPQQVSSGELLKILLEGFFQMCEDGDFDINSILEYIKITDLNISAPGAMTRCFHYLGTNQRATIQPPRP